MLLHRRPYRAFFEFYGRKHCSIWQLHSNEAIRRRCEPRDLELLGQRLPCSQVCAVHAGLVHRARGAGEEVERFVLLSALVEPVCDGRLGNRGDNGFGQ